MLGRSGLMFPRLVYKDTIKLKNKKLENRERRLFTLDWSSFEAKEEKDFSEWASSHNVQVGESNIYHVQMFEPYDTLIKESVFALNSEYEHHIRRCAQLASSEWGLPTRFDTMIRELRLKPAISYVEVAFKLLTDCLYNRQINYFSRDYDYKYILPHAMMVKFWSPQTGRGCIEEHARLRVLRKRLEAIQKQVIDGDGTLLHHEYRNAKQLYYFLEAFDAYYKDMNDVISSVLAKKASRGVDKVSIEGEVDRVQMVKTDEEVNAIFGLDEITILGTQAKDLQTEK